MSHDTSLRALAERLGILSTYLSQDGSQLRSTSDETRIAILAAMGRDASSETLARAALDEIAEREAERIAEPAHVVRAAELRAPRAVAGGLRFRVPASWGVPAGARTKYELSITGENEGAPGVARSGEATTGDDGSFAIAVDPAPAPGYYDLAIAISARGRVGEARQRLVVVPERCVAPDRRAFGIIANLYSVRGARSWSVGDLTDLSELARWSGERGAAFVGVNPLHAIRTVGGEVSPYSPVSRLYRNSAYLDIEAIPELEECPEARAMLGDDSIRAELVRLRSSDRVEYWARARVARPILEALHRCFLARSGSGRPAPTSRIGSPGAPGVPGVPGVRDARVATGAGGAGDERRNAYAAYREREGGALDDFATFMALDEHFVREGNVSVTWQRWPAEYRSPGSRAVREFARAHEREVDFHRWLQFELDRQLARAAVAGASAGLSLGIYQDLAVASAPYGSDAWSRQSIHASGVTFGAPPDDYSATGQNWGLLPLDPHRLREDGYRFWSALLRSSLRHAGAIRIDHVLGLFRQFWIPAGMDGSTGAYVRFPTADLMGILALESAKNGAVIVGEDLGTVPAEVPGVLREWGILGTRVLLFERDHDRTFRPAAGYEPLSLATADTHDLPTLPAFWEGRDIALATEVGRIATPDAERAALRSRQADRRLLSERLIADGALGADRSGRSTERPATAELVKAVHRFLCSTPAVLVGISLDDLAGESEPVNLPGVSAERFASWTRRMRVPLGQLMAREDLLPPDGCEERG
jgi:4-alpha-glucanotransferase